MMIVAYRPVRRKFKNKDYKTNLLCIAGDNQEMFENKLKETLKNCDFEYNPEFKSWETSNEHNIRNLVNSLKSYKKYDEARFIKKLSDSVNFQSWTFMIIDKTLYILGKLRNYETELKKLNFEFTNTPIPHWATKRITRNQIALENLPRDLEREITNAFDSDQSKPLVKINGSLVYLIGFPVQVTKEIASRMRYFDKNAYQKDRYKHGDWDGYIDLYDHRTDSAPIGFLYKIEQVLDEFGIEYEIEDNRRTPRELEYEWNSYELREYQEEIVNKSLAQGSGFIASPTGSGKTIMAMRIIYELSYSALIVTNKLDLLWQWHEELEKTLGVEVGIIGDDEFREEDITVCTVQTAHNKKPLRNYDIFIVDEAHRLPAKTFYQLSKHVDSLHRFGFSATPERSDGAEMRFLAMTGKLIQLYSARDLIDMGYLAEPRFETIRGWSANDRDDLSWQKELSLACDDEATNKRIVRKAIELHDDNHYVYVDVRRIKHGKTLQKMINEHIECEFIYGKHDKNTRNKVFERFKQDRIILISTLIKEGVDLPKMSAIILAGPSKSDVENIQKVGRALRPKEDVNEAIVVDREDQGKFLRRWFNHRTKLFKKYYSF